MEENIQTEATTPSKPLEPDVLPKDAIIQFSDVGRLPALITDLREFLGHEEVLMEGAIEDLKEHTTGLRKTIKLYRDQARERLRDATRELQKRGV